MSQTQVLSYFTGLTITPIVIRIQYDQGSICFSIKEVDRSFVGQEIRNKGTDIKDHSANQHAVAAAGRLIQEQVLADYHGPVVVRLWNR